MRVNTRKNDLVRDRYCQADRLSPANYRVGVVKLKNKSFFLNASTEL